VVLLVVPVVVQKGGPVGLHPSAGPLVVPVGQRVVREVLQVVPVGQRVAQEVLQVVPVEQRVAREVLQVVRGASH